MITNKITQIQDAINKYNYTAHVVGDTIQIRNRKNMLAAIVTDNGVEQKYQGSKNLCGALVRDDIKRAIE